MRTIKSKTIKKGEFKGEKLKLVALNAKEQAENNDDKFAVAFGEYNDIDYSCETEKEATEFFNGWEK